MYSVHAVLAVFMACVLCKPIAENLVLICYAGDGTVGEECHS